MNVGGVSLFDNACHALDGNYLSMVLKNEPMNSAQQMVDAKWTKTVQYILIGKGK